MTSRLQRVHETSPPLSSDDELDKAEPTQIFEKYCNGKKKVMKPIKLQPKKLMYSTGSVALFQKSIRKVILPDLYFS